MKAKTLIEKLKEALVWCSGSADFGEGGQARVEWLKVQKLIDEEADDIKFKGEK